MTRIAVLGPGGVGGLVAAALARSGADVIVVAREETAAAIAAHGLNVRSAALGDFTATPRVATRLDEPATALLVATKHGGLDEALDRVAAAPDVVVPLLNGIEHLALLRARFGDRVVAGVIRVESDRPAPGEIVQTSPGVRVDLGPVPAARAAAVDELARGLREVGIDVVRGRTDADVMWGKLVRLNALALATTAFDEPLGAIRDDPAAGAALDACVREAAAVARAEGAALSAEDTLAELHAAHPGLGSSMQRDVAAGRPPELDAIAGAVLRAAARHGIRCPTIAALAGRAAARAGIDPPAGAG